VGRVWPGGALTGSLEFSVAFALHDDLVGVVGEAVDGALGQDRILEERDPLSSMDRLLVRIVEARRWRSRMTS